MLNIKNLQIMNAGESVEKKEHFYIVSGNVNWYSHYGEPSGGSLKNRKHNYCMIWSKNHIPEHTPRENHNLKRYTHPNVHCNTIYNSQDIEAT